MRKCPLQPRQIVILLLLLETESKLTFASECAKGSSSLLSGLDVNKDTSIVRVDNDHFEYLEKLQCDSQNVSALILEFERPSDLAIFLKDFDDSTKLKEPEYGETPPNVIFSIGSRSLPNNAAHDGTFSEFGNQLANISFRMGNRVKIAGVSVKVPYPICWDDFGSNYLSLLFADWYQNFTKVVRPEGSSAPEIPWGLELNKIPLSGQKCLTIQQSLIFPRQLARNIDFVALFLSPPSSSFAYDVLSSSFEHWSKNVMKKQSWLTGEGEKEVILSVDMDKKDSDQLEDPAQRSLYNSVLAKFAFKFGAESHTRVAFPLAQPVQKRDSGGGGMRSQHRDHSRVLALNGELLNAKLPYESFRKLMTVINSKVVTVLIYFPSDNLILQEFLKKLEKFNNEKERNGQTETTMKVIIRTNFAPGELQRYRQQFQDLVNLNSKYKGIISGVILTLAENLCDPAQLKNFNSTNSEIEELNSIFETMNTSLPLLSVGCDPRGSSGPLLPVLDNEGYQIVRKIQNHRGSVSYFQHHLYCDFRNIERPREYLEALVAITKDHKIEQLWLAVFCDTKDCSTINPFYEFVQNWVSTFRVNLVVEWAFDFYQPHGWFGSSSGFLGDGFEVEDRNFFVKADEPCVLLKSDGISERIPFHLNLAGVGVYLNLTEESTFGKASYPDLGLLLQLVTFRFKTLEIEFDGKFSKLEQVTSIFEQLVAQRRDLGSITIYLKVTQNSHRNQVDSTHIEVVQRVLARNTSSISGIHFSGSSSDCLKRTQLFRGELSEKFLRIGCEFKLEKKLPKFEKDKIENLNYVVLDIHLLTLLQEEAPEDFNFMVERGMFDTVYNIFQRAKDFRTEIRKANRNLEIFLRFRWTVFVTSTSRLTTPRKIRQDTEHMLRIMKFVNDFCIANKFQFFIYQSVDDDIQSSAADKDEIFERNGWWRLLDPSNLSDLSVYVERESEFLRLDTPKPENPLILKPPRTRATDDIQTSKSGVDFVVILVAGLAVATVVVMITTIAFLWLRLRRRNQILSREEVQLFLYGLKKGNETIMSHEDKMILGNPYNGSLEIKRDDFIPESSTVIGAGNFGAVYKTHIRRLGGTVAVKVPHPSGASSAVDSAALHSNFKMLLSEIKIMSCVREHENVLKILGAYTKEIRAGIVYIVLEFCEHGNLLGYLRSLTKHQVGEEGQALLYELYRFSEEIAQGMEYIGLKNIIHGDLSARNVLLSIDKICKISDFGLSRKLENYSKYIKEGSEPLPWRWLAVETLRRMEFTVKSDVWSYGVNLWEIFTLLGGHSLSRIDVGRQFRGETCERIEVELSSVSK